MRRNHGDGSCGGLSRGVRYGDPRRARRHRSERWPPEQLPTIREAELAECLRILGVTEHHWLGYPDGGCASADADAAVEHIAEIIRDVRPDTILTFPPDGQTGHPDHIAVHRWTLEAVRRTGIGTLHVVANTQEWLDDHLARWTELGAIVGEPPVAWTGPLSIDLSVTGELLESEVRGAGCAGQPNRGAPRGARRADLSRDHPGSSGLRPSYPNRHPCHTSRPRSHSLCYS